MFLLYFLFSSQNKNTETAVVGIIGFIPFAVGTSKRIILITLLILTLLIFTFLFIWFLLRNL